MKKTDRPLREQTPTTPPPPGAFRADGSWFEDGRTADRGPTHRLVAALVRERRLGRLTPPDAADVIEAANAIEAFPSFAQWRSIDSWPAAWTRSNAEECVKREARGTDGHWCGERWLAGPEKNCEHPTHRPRSSHDEVRTQLDNIAQALLAQHATTSACNTTQT